ncbi:SurA N-terminal domain-containing protein [Solimonas soli]|uniref:SurA N-terminal domain-containing protein n=1 Tax=Solimonas soli TaxID=413479 RepID=UPI0004844F7E|nr:SurA N-terminal domain-containing protein [Solimonas soli]
MLQSIRDRTSGIVAGFIVAIIVVPFAFWGVESFMTGGGDPVVAKVGSEKIKDSQFRRAYEQRYQQYLQLMGDNFRADQFDQNRFRQSVLDDMTQEAMMRQYANKAGYRANDALLFSQLSSYPVFQKDGKFDTETYKEALARQRLSPQRFEAQLRESLEIDQMREAVVDTAFMTATERQQLMQIAGQEREVSYARFDLAKYEAQLTVSDADAQKRYEESKSQYMAPERIKLAYVELSPDTLPAAPVPDKDVLKVLYDAEKDSRFTTPEQRRASHILINFGADKSASEKKAEDLAAQLKNGADFAALAKANSDDAGSRAKGGDLGWLKRGQMPDSFEKALWSLKSGETSAPVETEFGWHLIHVDEVKPSTVKPFEDAEVQAELIELYRNREKQKHFQELSDKLEQLAFENPASLDVVAKELGLQVQTTDWFTRTGGEGLAANDAVKEAAFSAEVLKDGENSKPLAIGDDKLVVIRKAEYEAPRQRSFDEVAADIRTALRAEQAKAKAKADADALLAAVKGGETLSAAAGAKGIEIKDVGALRRDNREADQALVDAVFKMPRPKGDVPSYGEVTLGDGNVAVVALRKVSAPAADNLPPEAGAQFNQLAAGEEFQAYRSYVASQVKVKIVNPPQAETPASPDQ